VKQRDHEVKAIDGSDLLSILCNSITLLYDEALHERINYFVCMGEMTSVHFWPLRQINVLPHFELRYFYSTTTVLLINLLWQLHYILQFPAVKF